MRQVELEKVDTAKNWCGGRCITNLDQDDEDQSCEKEKGGK